MTRSAGLPGDVDNFYRRHLTRFGGASGSNWRKFEATDDEVDAVDDADGEIMQIYPGIENDGVNRA